MANLIEMSEQLKAVPDEWLTQQIENPSGMVPPYLALGELNRRKTLRSKMAQGPQSTVAQDVTQPSPGMGGTDMLNNRQPQPQQPQQPQSGMPNPMPGGLQAASPPMPQGPPAPQRMAQGGLVEAAADDSPGYDQMTPWWNRLAPGVQERLKPVRMATGGAVPGGGGVPGVLHVTQASPEWFEDEEQPWWKRSLGMYGLSSLGGMGGLGIMGGLGPALLAGLFAHRGKKKSGTDVTVTTPAAPAAMAEGGPIRMAGSGLASIPNFSLFPAQPRSFSRLPLSPYGRPEDDEDVVMEIDADGNRVMRVPGKGTLKFPAPTPIKFPEYRDTTPVDVEVPDLARVLEQVREVTKRPEGPTALDRRMEALEAHREDIRKPTRGDWLIDAGLGMMASRSPHGLQALGESALGATQNYRQRKQQALKDTLGLDERLASFEAAREEMAERARRSDLDLAKELGHQQYGASVVKAQTAGQREAARQRYDLAMAEAEAKHNQQLFTLDTGLNEKVLGHWLRPPEHHNIDPNSPEGIAAEAIRNENRARTNAQYRVGRSGTDYSFARRPLPDAQVDTVARAMIKDQAKKWGVGGEDTWQTYLGRVQNTLGDEVLAGEKYMDDPTMAEVLANDRNRFAIAQRIKALSFDASKGRDKDWLAEVRKYVQTGREAELAKGKGKPRPGITFGFGAQAPSDRRAKVFEPSTQIPF